MPALTRLGFPYPWRWRRLPPPSHFRSQSSTTNPPPSSSPAPRARSECGAFSPQSQGESAICHSTAIETLFHQHRSQPFSLPISETRASAPLVAGSAHTPVSASLPGVNSFANFPAPHPADFSAAVAPVATPGKALSTPYLKYGSPLQHQQGAEKSKDQEGLTKGLKSRGLCLVPISSTFPVATETPSDFWTPTFGVNLK